MVGPSPFVTRARSVTSVGLLGLAVVFGALVYWQVFRTDLATEANNPRVVAAATNPNRGRILDRSGAVLAESYPGGTRHYPDASVAQVVGYLSPRFGAAGVELALNDVLSGLAGESWQQALSAEFGVGDGEDRDVYLTLDARVQAVAARALGARKGAVVALDPRSGDVLAMVSVPTYDPGSVDAVGQSLLTSADSPLLNRATQGLYPPGSTFKVVTAAALLEAGVVTPETTVSCLVPFVVEGFAVRCDNVPQGTGSYPFRDAFAYSVNAVFAEEGLELGWSRLTATASKFGFGARLGFTLPTEITQIRGDGSAATGPLLASTAFGQGELLATPLQMAMVAATVGNGGVRVDPRLVLGSGTGGKLANRYAQSGSRRVVSAEVARQVADMMVGVIERGQASGVSIPGVKVAGKTGTAEVSNDGTSHAWFIGFAPSENPTIAVAVVVERGGRGGEVAAPIGGQVIREALAR